MASDDSGLSVATNNGASSSLSTTRATRPAQAALSRVERVGAAAVPGVLATLMELTSDAVLTLDANGTILTANAQAALLAELSQDELAGANVADILFDPSRPHDAAGLIPLLPADGSLAEISCRLASGGATMVAARCDRASAPGETYVLVMRPVDRMLAAEREHDRLLDELSLANRRLSGTLRIILDTIDANDFETLFRDVLEQMTDTLDAHGALLFIAEASGYRLSATTLRIDAARAPQFMAYGEGLETLVTRAGHALRLRLLPPSERSLRAGALTTRDLLDEESGARCRIPARQVPPFASLICVPVWFGGHVIAIIEVGWAEARPSRRDDARLLDSVSQYLSIEFAAAISSMRADRAQRLDDLAQRLHDIVENDPRPPEGDLTPLTDALCKELDVTLVPLICKSFNDTCVADLPGLGEVTILAGIDELVSARADAGIAVVPIERSRALVEALEVSGCDDTGVLLDLGELGGERRSFLVLRDAGAEPIDSDELDFLRRVAIDVRQAAEAGERRIKDTRISQALQSGMRNELQHIEGITAHGLYSSATEAALVGGDFYDLIRLPNRRACVILGDVSGKGVEAASVSAAVKTALGAYAWEGQPPARMIRLLNNFLLGFSRLETFATMFVGIVDLQRATLTYCSAGHPPAIFLRAEPREMFTLDEQSGVVGAFRAMSYHDGHVRLRVGDRLLLYTDGVTEARDPHGAFFGEQGLRDAVMEEAGGSDEGLLDRLLARIDSFTRRSLDDDVAMVTLRFDELG